MKVLVECEIWFSLDINAAELSEATSGPMIGDVARFEDIECMPENGKVGIATLVGFYNHPNRTDTDEEAIEEDSSILVSDILHQYGFPNEEVKVDIKDYC